MCLCRYMVVCGIAQVAHSANNTLEGTVESEYHLQWSSGRSLLRTMEKE